MKKLLLLLLLCFPFAVFAQSYNFIQQTSGTSTSIRGMSIVSDQVAWVSGSNGTVGRTVDGGLTWQWIKPEGY